VICYGGRGVRPIEAKWSITELECLSVIERLKFYHNYIAGNQEFDVFTDHVSLTYLKKMKLSTHNNRLTRWALFIQPYKFKTHCKPGSKMTSADALSRIPRDQKGTIVQQSADDANTTQAATTAEPKKRVVFTFDETGHDVAAISNVQPLPTTDDFIRDIQQCPASVRCTSI
jgi:RNase H-like domain found in reverse transcriptase